MMTAIGVLVAVLAAPAAGTATGRVVGPDGAAITGAQVCELVDDKTERCVPVDASGVYRFTNPSQNTLLVRASGYVAKTVDAAPLAAPVELQRAAVLEVQVVDAATKLPLHAGRVMIDSPSGKRIGKFVPFNQHGVRISTLEPGDVFVRAEADGYAPGGPLVVTLASGSKSSVTILMTKAEGTRR